MENFTKGQRAQMASMAPSGMVHLGARSQGPALDFSCYGLTADGKLASDDYMTFFNQPSTPCGGVKLAPGSGEQAGFDFDLSRLPANIERVVLAASLDGSGSMAQLGASSLRLSSQGVDKAEYAFNGSDFTTERALMLGEFYRRDGQWRFMVVGQGFAGGLDALARHFGADVADAAPAPAQPQADSAKISLAKRIAAEAPQLVSLVKTAGVSLEKAGLQDHKAKVCLCLDISISMDTLYQKGLVQQLSERILALGCSFDDDGEIDVFLFGRDVHQPAPMGLANCKAYVNDVTRKHPLEGGTYYGKAMRDIRAFYFPDAKGGQRTAPRRDETPVYVMFVTDGATADESDTKAQLRWSSNEPIFWQFMGIGPSSKNQGGFFSSIGMSNFKFLEDLDKLDGRLIDNAGFFSVEKPGQGSDGQLYDQLMAEYPEWLKKARIHGMLPEGPRPASAPKPRP